MNTPIHKSIRLNVQAIQTLEVIPQDQRTSWEDDHPTARHIPRNGPYGLIRIGDIYFNQNGIFNLEGKKISTKLAKLIMGIS